VPKKILLVDDDPDLIEILKYELDSANYQVETAPNGEEALKILQNFIPNLIISDVTMPVMDGVDFFEALKNNPKTERIPVLILIWGPWPMSQCVNSGVWGMVLIPLTAVSKQHRSLISPVDRWWRLKLLQPITTRPGNYTREI